VGQELMHDWENEIRKPMMIYGLRFSVLEGYMPCESSSVKGNTTNALYPIRERAVIKTIGTNKTVFLAPDWEILGPLYQFAWDIPHNDMFECYAIFQKFCGQAISADSYRSFKDGERKVSMRELLANWRYRNALGIKTKYYTNSAASADVSSITDSCAGGGCSV
jgi:ribonucleoside-diphosphate reductase alpha chain